MDWMVNNIQLTWKFAWIFFFFWGKNFAWMLRIYKTCNSMIWFSKYEFYNKLLGGVTLLKVM